MSLSSKGPGSVHTIQWNPSNPDTSEPKERVPIREVSLFCTNMVLGEEESFPFGEVQGCPYS